MEALNAAPPRPEPLGPPQQLALAQRVLRSEAAAVLALANRLDDRFCRATGLLLACTGSVMVSGMGKAGLIGQKIAATLCSTGTRSHFLHPAEAVHGDLGRVAGEDVVLLLSQSGETAEAVQLLAPLTQLGAPIIALTGNAHSTVARAATVTLDLGRLAEACPLGLAPTTSTTAMLALGDALALCVSRMKGFRRQDFAQLHPGGSLGRRLSRVETHMRPLGSCRLARDSASIREVLVGASRPGRRTGAIMLTDGDGRLTGLFTDSDLARLLEQKAEHALDRPVHAVMTSDPLTVSAGTMLVEALRTMAEHKISELPVIDAQRCPAGLLDITDLLPTPEEFPQHAQSPPRSDQIAPDLRVFSNREREST